MPRITPPRPPSRPNDAGLLERIRRFRTDMFRSQPERLYSAKMAQVRTPFFDSVLVNDPALVAEILDARARDFPKADLIADTLAPLLGQSVFVTNKEAWSRQRRLIDPAFEAGRVRAVLPAMRAAVADAVYRMSPGPVDVEAETAHLAADVIFRTLFSMPIGVPLATETFAAFRDYQRAQPLFSPLDLIRAPRWIPRRRPGKAAAARIRTLLATLVTERAAMIAAGTAPDDLATRIMTARDPAGGPPFDTAEMVDQVAIFFLAGHETSASALSWALYCLARDDEAQDAVVAEVSAVLDRGPLDFSAVAGLRFTRDVFKETLRLYPPVPMMVRQTAGPETLRGRRLRRGSLAIVSPWHMHRHQNMWDDPDTFDPWRWGRGDAGQTAKDAYLPFSKGPRVCTGAGFAMVEGVLSLAMLVRAYRFAPVGPPPVPVAHLTLRSEAGITLTVSLRDGPDTRPEREA